MEVPLYNIFGDNYVIQVATEAENSTVSINKVEIDDNELRKVLDLVYKIAKKNEEALAERRSKAKKKKGEEGDTPTSNLILPLSGNDKNPWTNALKCYNFPTTASLSDIFKNFSQVKECEEVSAPSFIKPEFYEFGRSPGMVERARKMKLEVEPHYLIIAAAGWVLTRLGKAKVSENNYVGVNVFTPTRSILYSLVDNVNGIIPGIKPETAFALWIARKVASSVSNPKVNVMRIYTMTDAVGQTPTTINGGFTIDLTRLLEKTDLLSERLEAIARNALSVNSNMRDRYIVLANYIYEYLTGSKRLEDLLYFANRDLIMNLDSNDEKVRDLKLISAYVNGELMKGEK
ncbi:type I-A CRISPR-associated protein CsaX [Acidianus sulfidivorans JP7]|uniref:Type I-A CRISPR-associated protein CsaX n=1 Tax=Acidianus sulfidivorans JP7 TaxID=619593 RepID=A0A2U9IQ08_9CREN|nr:type I-A CRISPR-associated protein CsaX [Acidianus sulfidivorans]AWR98110.1 type I-A CRISPR-associated protein CsaX [Acidianus sulfidivorans JP7]